MNTNIKVCGTLFFDRVKRVVHKFNVIICFGVTKKHVQEFYKKPRHAKKTKIISID